MDGLENFREEVSINIKKNRSNVFEIKNMTKIIFSF